MKLLISVIALLILVSCGVPEISKDFKKEYIVKGDNINGRVYLTHGFRGDLKEFTQLNMYIDLINGIASRGYQVVIYSYPYTTRDTFSNSGLDYSNKYHEHLNWLTNELERDYGMALDNVAMGIDFGGLHSLMAATFKNKDNYLFDRYVAILPVTKPENIDELKGIESTYFNPFNYTNEIDNTQGLIVYNLDDNEASTESTEKFINEITNIEHTGLNGISNTYIDDITNSVINWL